MSVLTLGSRGVIKHLPGFKEMEVPPDIAYLHKYAPLRRCHRRRRRRGSDEDDEDDDDEGGAADKRLKRASLEESISRSPSPTRGDNDLLSFSSSSSSLTSASLSALSSSSPYSSPFSFAEAVSHWRANHCPLDQSRVQISNDQSSSSFADQLEAGVTFDQSESSFVEDASLLTLQSVVSKRLRESIPPSCGQVEGF